MKLTVPLELIALAPAIPAMEELSCLLGSLSFRASLSVMKEQAAAGSKNILAHTTLPLGPVTFDWHGIIQTCLFLLGCRT